MNISEDIVENQIVNTFFENIASELLEKILHNLDAVTLTVAKSVCTRWNHISETFQEIPHYWRSACLRTIPRNCLTEIIGQAFGGEGQVSNTDAKDYDLDTLDWVDWRDVFAAWGRAHKVGKWSSNIASFTPSMKHQGDVVTQIRVTGEYIVTGHSWGHRTLWHANEQVSCPGSHMGCVTDLALLDLLHSPPYQSGMLHHALVSTGGDGCLVVTVLLDHLTQSYHDKYTVKMRAHEKATTRVKVLGSLMAVLSEDNVVSLWHLSMPSKEETDLPVLCLQRKIPGPAEDLIMTSLWPNNLVFWMQKLVAVDCRWQARIYPINNESGLRKQWESKEFTLVRPGSQEERARSGLITIRSGHGENDTVDVVKQDWGEAGLGNRAALTQLSRAMVFHDNMYAILSGHDIFLSVDGIHYRHYNVFPHLHSIVTALTVYLQFLVLGTSTGRVSIYHLSSPTKLLILDLDTPSWRGNVAGGAITSICLADSGDRLVLAVGAGEEVVATKWFSRWGGEAGGLIQVKDGLGDVLD